MGSTKKPPASSKPTIQELDEVVIRFAGDSGDGMQLVGAQFTATAAAVGNDISTLPDFPAEIRAPAGTLAGVSGFQVRFSNHEIHTPGDVLNALVAMNPAALQANVKDLEPGGILVLNTDAFTTDELDRAGYHANPLLDGSLKRFRLVAIPMNKLNRDAVSQFKLSPREADRCRNFFALGLVYWLFERPLEPSLRWIRDRFSKNPAMVEANTRTLMAGYQHCESAKLMRVHYRVAKAEIPAGRYRKITGTEALALGLVTAGRLSGLPLVFACHPMTPASDVMQQMVEMKRHGVRMIQAEDELAALSMAIGASFGGTLGVTATSGPGMSLMSEGIGLAVMSELPCVVINIQRGGPSTGLPTRSEQADLFQALVGRHGEAPLPVLAPAHPSECFALALEAVRLATRYMTPVILLSDVYLANGAEPWKIPEVGELPDMEVVFAASGKGVFLPYRRDEHLARPWAAPGTPGLEHRIGGLETERETGHVSYDAENHEAMIRERADKIARIAEEIPPLQVHGADDADLLVLGWGSTYGAIFSAVKRCQAQGLSVACAHLRHLSPLPKNTGEILARHRRLLVPELNSGQLAWLIRAVFVRDLETLNKVQGKPFLISEVEAKIHAMLRA